MFVLLVALNVVYTAPHECRAERNGRPAKARCICGSALWREWWCGVKAWLTLTVGTDIVPFCCKGNIVDNIGRSRPRDAELRVED